MLYDVIEILVKQYLWVFLSINVLPINFKTERIRNNNYKIYQEKAVTSFRHTVWLQHNDYKTSTKLENPIKTV